MPWVYIGTSKLKCAYVWTTAVKCIYVWTTKVRPTSPTIDYLIAWGGGGWGDGTNSRQWGWGWGWGQVKYCCGYSINTWSYTVTVGSWGGTATWGGTSCFNGICSKWGCGGMTAPWYISSYYRSGCGWASGSGCAWGTCGGVRYSSCYRSWWGWGWQCGAWCASANGAHCSLWGCGVCLNFTWATVEYGKWGMSWPYNSQTTTLCSQWGAGCGWAWSAWAWGGGIVIIKYPSSCWYSITWGTKTSATISGVTYCIHCFTSNGTLKVS